MTDCHRQGVGGVSLGRFDKVVKQYFDHMLNLLLGSLAVSDHRLLDLQGRVLEDRHSLSDTGHHGSPPGLPQFQSALDIVGKKDILHRHGIRGMTVDDRGDPAKNMFKAAGKVGGRIGPDPPVIQMEEPVPFLADKAIPGDARAWIDTEDYQRSYYIIFSISSEEMSKLA